MSTATSPFVTRVVTAPMRQLLRDLRAAGWCHAKEWIDTGRDPIDGSPHDDGTEVHRYRRNGEAITAWAEYTSWAAHLTYDPHADEGNEDGEIYIGKDWLERYGTDGLRKLAVTFGCIPVAGPITPITLADPQCCGEPMVHNSFTGEWECFRAFQDLECALDPKEEGLDINPGWYRDEDVPAEAVSALRHWRESRRPDGATP